MLKNSLLLCLLFIASNSHADVQNAAQPPIPHQPDPGPAPGALVIPGSEIGVLRTDEVKSVNGEKVKDPLEATHKLLKGKKHIRQVTVLRNGKKVQLKKKSQEGKTPSEADQSSADHPKE